MSNKVIKLNSLKYIAAKKEEDLWHIATHQVYDQIKSRDIFHTTTRERDILIRIIRNILYEC